MCLGLVMIRHVMGASQVLRCKAESQFALCKKSTLHKKEVGHLMRAPAPGTAWMRAFWSTGGRATGGSAPLVARRWVHLIGASQTSRTPRLVTSAPGAQDDADEFGTKDA